MINATNKKSVTIVKIRNINAVVNAEVQWKLRKQINDIMPKTTGTASAWMIRALDSDVNLKAMPMVAPHIDQPMNA